MAKYKCAGVKRGRCTYEDDVGWPGRPCPGCHRYYNFDQRGAGTEQAKMSFVSTVPQIERAPTGISHFDEVIGGGIVEGAVILLGGSRGSGKTTFLVTICDAFATDKRRVIYASSEENAESVIQIANRVGAANPHVEVIGNAFDLDAILKRADEVKPALLVVDSLQAITDGEGIDSGSPAGRGVQAILEIGRFCEKNKTCVIVTNHITRNSEFAGSTTVEHFVKAIFQFAPFDEKIDGLLQKSIPNDEARDLMMRDRTKDVRVFLGVGKNRIGPADEKRFFEMTSNGILRPIPQKATVELMR